MFLTGFADEASEKIDIQIEVTKRLGWKNIEARGMFGSKNIASISDAEFEELQEKLSAAGISINCYGSGIANWGKHPRKEEDFQASLDELNAGENGSAAFKIGSFCI